MAKDWTRTWAIGVLMLAGASSCADPGEAAPDGAGGSGEAGESSVLPRLSPTLAGGGGEEPAEPGVDGMNVGGAGVDSVDAGGAGSTAVGGTPSNGCVPGGITDAPTFASDVDLSKSIKELSADEIRLLCLEMSIFVRDSAEPFVPYVECLRDLSHEDPTCEASASSYTAYALRRDCASLGSVCPKILEPDPWLEPGERTAPLDVSIAGSVGDDQVELISGRRPSWPTYDSAGYYRAGAAWEDSALSLWGSLRYGAYQGILQFVSPSTDQARFICMDDVSAKFNDEPDWINITAMLRVFDSAALSELSCAAGGSPFELAYASTYLGPAPTNSGTLDGEVITRVWAKRPSCGPHNCVVPLAWGEGVRHEASLVVVTDQQHDIGLEDVDLTIPFTSSYLVELGGEGNVRCGGGGSLTYVANVSYPDPFSREVEEQLVIHVDSLALPSTCPGVPLPGALHGTDN